MTNRYTVIGQPIAHSLSPVVHHLFGDQTLRDIHYTRTEASPESFEQVVLDFQAAGAKGCNVTAPFKEQAVGICDDVVPLAMRAGSVNTIHMRQDGKRVGHSTDGAGLVADIQNNHSRALNAKRILLLGAGGAARGVVEPLLATKPSHFHIANRTASKASDLATIFSDLGALSAGGYDALESAEPYDIIINATTPSADGGMPDIPPNVISENTLAYDMTYASLDTVFMQWGKRHRATACNGLGMLVEQAAEAFLIWEGIRPQTQLVFPRLHEILAKTERA